MSNNKILDNLSPLSGYADHAGEGDMAALRHIDLWQEALDKAVCRGDARMATLLLSAIPDGVDPWERSDPMGSWVLAHAPFLAISGKEKVLDEVWALFHAMVEAGGHFALNKAKPMPFFLVELGRRGPEDRLRTKGLLIGLRAAQEHGLDLDRKDRRAETEGASLLHTSLAKGDFELADAVLTLGGSTLGPFPQGGNLWHALASGFVRRWRAGDNQDEMTRSLREWCRRLPGENSANNDGHTPASILEQAMGHEMKAVLIEVERERMDATVMGAPPPSRARM